MRVFEPGDHEYIERYAVIITDDPAAVRKTDAFNPRDNPLGPSSLSITESALNELV